MFRFPWSNFHELNLDWILEVVKEAKEIFVNGRSDIDNAVETANEALEVAEQAASAVIADGAITIPKLNNEVLKTTAHVIVGNRADDPVPAGDYVYLRNSLVAGLSDGIYTAATGIPAGAIVTPAEFQQSTELHDAGALNVLKNTLNQLETETETVENGLAIIVDGNICASGASQGQYVYLKDSTITGYTDGLYTAAQAIPANTAIDGTYLTAVTDGGLNHLKQNTIKETKVISLTSGVGDVSKSGYTPVACYIDGGGSADWVTQLFCYNLANNEYRARVCLATNPSQAHGASTLTMIIFYIKN